MRNVYSRHNVIRYDEHNRPYRPNSERNLLANSIDVLGALFTITHAEKSVSSTFPNADILHHLLRVPDLSKQLGIRIAGMRKDINLVSYAVDTRICRNSVYGQSPRTSTALYKGPDSLRGKPADCSDNV